MPTIQRSRGCRDCSPRRLHRDGSPAQTCACFDSAGTVSHLRQATRAPPIKQRIRVASLRSRQMTLSRRKLLCLAAGAIGLPATPRMAFALDYPTRPVRLLVGFATGGAAEVNARIMGQWLAERLGQPFAVENRTGAGSNIAAEA